MGDVSHTEQCPRCAARGGDTRCDNLVVYKDDESCHCFACGYTRPSKEYLVSIGKYEEEYVIVGSEFNQDIHSSLKSKTIFDPKGYRGLKENVCKYFGVRHAFDDDNNITKQYYPVTKGGVISGYKVRKEPKDFEAIGETGKDCDLFGWFRFKDMSGKVCVITSGEIDMLSAYQMIREHQVAKYGEDSNIYPVVSSTIGESGSYKQIQTHFDWFNRFDKVILCYDNDNAGHEAVAKVAKVLPKNKVYTMRLVLKDANEYLKQGKQQNFIDLFYRAEKYTPSGIIASTGMMEAMKQEVKTPKVPLPPFMKDLSKMTAGGIPLGVIVNLASSSGAGKSTVADELTYYWVLNSPHRIGVVSLESDVGQYGLKVLSRHVGKKIDLIEDPEEKEKYLDRPDVVEKANELWMDEQGNPRWYLVDERDGDISQLKTLVENMIISCDCKIIILDPLQDILDGLGNDEQAVFLKWMKGMTKSHKATFININHVRKNGGGQQANSTGAELFEEDMQGTSAIFKSGALNLLFTRNKEAEDPIERNTIKMKSSKCRWTGRTGIAGEYYYEIETHTLHDKKTWLANKSKVVNDDKCVNTGDTCNTPLEQQSVSDEEFIDDFEIVD